MAPPEIAADVKDPERQVENIEKKDSSEGSKIAGDEDHGPPLLLELPAAEERKILSKVDYRLVPILSLLYLVAFIDRSNSKLSSPDPL